MVNLILDVVLIFGFGPIPQTWYSGCRLSNHTFLLAEDTARQLGHLTRSTTYRPLPSRNARAMGSGHVSATVRVRHPCRIANAGRSGLLLVIMLQVGRFGRTHHGGHNPSTWFERTGVCPHDRFGDWRRRVGRATLDRRTYGFSTAHRHLHLGVTTIYTGIFVLCLGLAPNAMLAFYAWGTPVERFDSMRPMLLPLLQIIAFYCVVDGLQVVFSGGDQRCRRHLVRITTTLAVCDRRFAKSDWSVRTIWVPVSCCGGTSSPAGSPPWASSSPPAISAEAGKPNASSRLNCQLSRKSTRVTSLLQDATAVSKGYRKMYPSSPC